MNEQMLNWLLIVIFTLGPLLLIYFILGFAMVWVNHGTRKQNLKIKGVNIPVFSKGDVDIDGFCDCEDLVDEYFNKHDKYLDKNVLKNTVIIIKDDLSCIKNGQQFYAIGQAKRIFWARCFRNVNVILISRNKMQYLRSNKKMVSFVVFHEFLHNWLNEHEGNSDPFHENECWIECGVRGR